MGISADRYCISCPYVPTILIHHAFFTIKTFLVTRTFTLPFTTKIIIKCVSERLYGWNQSTATTTSSGDGGSWCDHSSNGLQHDRLRPTSGLQPAVRSDSSSGLQLGAVRLRSRLDTGQSRYSSQCTLCGMVCCHYIIICYLICRKHKLATLCMGLNAYKLEKLVYVHI